MADHDKHVKDHNKNLTRIRNNEHNPEAREEASQNIAAGWKQYNKDKARGK